MGMVNRIGESAAIGPGRPALTQTGKAGEVWGIALSNLVFTILTLGIYRFWGVAKLRRYLWSHTGFAGEPLEYTGTGKEQFIGFLLALVLVGLPLGALAGASQHFLLSGQTDLGMAMQGIYMLALLFLPGFAMYRARRYRLSRTVWRGIRGAQTGSALSYGLRWGGWLLLMPLTLGIMWPLRSIALMRYKMNHTLFGNRAFAFEAKVKAGPLYAQFVPALLCCFALAALSLLVPHVAFDILDRSDTLWDAETAGMMMGLSPLLCLVLMVPVFWWYRLREWNFFAEHIQFGGLRFSFDAAFFQVLALIVTNFLLTLFTLGLGGPYAQLRTARFICARLFIEGEQDFAEIAQSGEARPKQGEGLAAMFDSAEF